MDKEHEDYNSEINFSDSFLKLYYNVSLTSFKLEIKVLEDVCVYTFHLKRSNNLKCT